MNEDLVVMKPINPWVGMLIQPRETMRYILETEPRRHMHTLAILGGVAGQLLAYAVSPYGSSLGWSVLLGAVNGLISLYVYGFLLTWVGRLLGGRGTSAEVRAALAWACVPNLWAIALAVVMVIAFGVVGIDLGVFDGPSIVLLAVVAVGTLWTAVVQYKAVGVAHDFSTWRSFVAHALIGIVLLAVLMGLAMAWLSLMNPYSSPYSLV